MWNLWNAYNFNPQLFHFNANKFLIFFSLSHYFRRWCVVWFALDTASLMSMHTQHNTIKLQSGFLEA